MATQQFDIEILNVGNPVFTKTARGGYNSMEVAYKNITFEGKVEGKKLVDFNDKAVFEFIKGLKNGDKVTITKDKGEQDQYWKWVGADFTGAAGVGSASAAQGSTAAASSGAGNSGASEPANQSRGRVTGSNYETPEERALRRGFEEKKHRQIGRQGCLNTAIEILKTQEGPVTVEAAIETAKQLEAFVFPPNGDIPF